ncbi:oxidoreductase [Nocardia nova]|uniref:Oxidoreductase n=1 Tax=Nocardia nova TaxID=37330 RepID=A0A2S6AKF1_9NOCA|nr:SDR family oxidoreductase [Nocardia nova]PPJ24930.1 oxidoreductase [Nocardia nova]PPJ35692.1 oxidoreductase [Nocardia nova]
MSAPIVVTGGSSGIGLALVQRLHARSDVVVIDRNMCPVPGVVTFTCDLADPTAIHATTSQLPAALSGLANVAGVPGTASPHTVLAVNVLAPQLLVADLLGRMGAGATIVNVASVAAHRNTRSPEAIAELAAARGLGELDEWLRRHPTDGPAAYDTSKRVLVDWTRALAAHLVGRGIRALSISPGPVETPILADFTASMGIEAMERSAGAVGRHGRPEEIAAVIDFMLSPDASWVNGIDIPVEGGLFATRSAPFPVAEGLHR